MLLLLLLLLSSAAGVTVGEPIEVVSKVTLCEVLNKHACILVKSPVNEGLVQTLGFLALDFFRLSLIIVIAMFFVVDLFGWNDYPIQMVT